jgi:hypothetical protein
MLKQPSLLEALGSNQKIELNDRLSNNEIQLMPEMNQGVLQTVMQLKS